MALRVEAIFEGQGDHKSIRILLERFWYELLGGDYIDVMRPFRQPQGTLLKEEGLKKAVEAAKIKLGPDTPGGTRTLVLILIDAESNCPRDLAPRLVSWAKQARTDADIACVFLIHVRDVVRCRGGIARRSEWSPRRTFRAGRSRRKPPG